MNPGDCLDADRACSAAWQPRPGTVGRDSWRSDMVIGPVGPVCSRQSGIGREDGVNGLRALVEPGTIIPGNQT